MKADWMTDEVRDMHADAKRLGTFINGELNAFAERIFVLQAECATDDARGALDAFRCGLADLLGDTLRPMLRELEKEAAEATAAFEERGVVV